MDVSLKAPACRKVSRGVATGMQCLHQIRAGGISVADVSSWRCRLTAGIQQVVTGGGFTPVFAAADPEHQGTGTGTKQRESPLSARSMAKPNEPYNRQGDTCQLDDVHSNVWRAPSPCNLPEADLANRHSLARNTLIHAQASQDSPLAVVGTLPRPSLDWNARA